MYQPVYHNRIALGQADPVLTERPEWQRWLRVGMDLISGDAALRSPEVVLEQPPKTFAEKAVSNPIFWVLLAGVAIAFTRGSK